MIDHNTIAIVSGLPRSGTSLMMSMLEAGGTELLTDGLRTADDDNPRGYYEFEQVKKIKEDKSWVDQARGKVVKLISQLVYEVPLEGFRYKVVFMRRNIDEILASQTQMLKRRGTHDPSVSDDEIRRMFLVHLDHVVNWLNEKECVDVLYVNYNRLIKEPAEIIDRLNGFFGGDLDTTAMASRIDKKLYRQRANQN